VNAGVEDAEVRREEEPKTQAQTPCLGHPAAGMAGVEAKHGIWRWGTLVMEGTARFG